MSLLHSFPLSLSKLHSLPLSNFLLHMTPFVSRAHTLFRTLPLSLLLAFLFYFSHLFFLFHQRVLLSLSLNLSFAFSLTISPSLPKALSLDHRSSSSASFVCFLSIFGDFILDPSLLVSLNSLNLSCSPYRLSTRLPFYHTYSSSLNPMYYSIPHSLCIAFAPYILSLSHDLLFSPLPKLSSINLSLSLLLSLTIFLSLSS